MTKTYHTPGGKASNLALDMLKQPHLLIAGATGSGKSVLINTLIYTALYKSPLDIRLILIDPKKVELIDYKDLPHTISYADDISGIIKTLKLAVDIMDKRYAEMQKARIKRYNEVDIYIIIDEYADLITVEKNAVFPHVQRLAQLGRAAGIHLIIATQRPTRDIIDGKIKVNLDSRIALRCPTKQDSRNIINVGGAELLPRYGYGYYLTPETMRPVMVEIPMTDESEIKKRVQWWTRQK